MQRSLKVNCPHTLQYFEWAKLHLHHSHRFVVRRHTCSSPQKHLNILGIIIMYVASSMGVFLYHDATPQPIFLGMSENKTVSCMCFYMRYNIISVRDHNFFSLVFVFSKTMSAIMHDQWSNL